MIEPIKITKDQLDAAILQCSIMKNYFNMTEMYLKLFLSNLEYIDKYYVESQTPTS